MEERAVGHARSEIGAVIVRRRHAHVASARLRQSRRRAAPKIGMSPASGLYKAAFRSKALGADGVREAETLEWRIHVGPRRAGGQSRSSRRRSIGTAPRWPRPSGSSPAIRRWFSPARRASSSARSASAAGGRGVPVAGRRLRRELRRAFGRQHPRLLPRLPADGGGDDVRGGLADRQGRPRRRPVRQAPLVGPRDGRRRVAAAPIAATSSTTSSSRRRRASPIRAASSRPTASRRRR